MKEIIVATLIFMIGVIVVLNFMPGSFNGNEELVKVVGMCDSVFVSKNDEVTFSLRNKSDENFYIASKLSESDFRMLQAMCSEQVITLVYYEPGIIANALQNSHRITAVRKDERLIYSAANLRGLTPQ